MVLPFTVGQFYAMAEQYNRAIWPMQIVGYALGLAAVIIAIKKVRYGDQVISAILAALWLWNGVVFHLLYFTPINSLAVVFGVLFIVQGVLFVLVGIVRPKLEFHLQWSPYSGTGVVFLTYAMLFYPIVGALVGHVYPRSFGFGVAPCPTTVFTVGLLLLTTRRVPKYILVIPLLWSLTGILGAGSLGIFEDAGMVVAGVVGTALLLWRDRTAIAQPQMGHA